MGTRRAGRRAHAPPLSRTPTRLSKRSWRGRAQSISRPLTRDSVLKRRVCDRNGKALRGDLIERRVTLFDEQAEKPEVRTSA